MKINQDGPVYKAIMLGIETLSAQAVCENNLHGDLELRRRIVGHIDKALRVRDDDAVLDIKHFISWLEFGINKQEAKILLKEALKQRAFEYKYKLDLTVINTAIACLRIEAGENKNEALADLITNSSGNTQSRYEHPIRMLVERYDIDMRGEDGSRRRAIDHVRDSHWLESLFGCITRNCRVEKLLERLESEQLKKRSRQRTIRCSL